MIFQVILELDQSVRLNLGWSGGWWKDKRHAVSMSTGRWSELSAQHEVRYTWNGTPSSLRCPRRRHRQRGCMVWWLGCLVQRLDKCSRRRNHVGVSPVLWSAASSNPRVWRWVRRSTGPAIPCQNKRLGLLRSMGGKVRGSPQGFSPVCRPMWLEQQWHPSGSGPERAMSGGLYHGGIGWLFRPPLLVCAVADIVG